MLKQHDFAIAHMVNTVHPRDAVAQIGDGANLTALCRQVKVAQLLFHHGHNRVLVDDLQVGALQQLLLQSV